MADWMTVPLLHYDYAGTIFPRVGLAHATIAPYGAYPVGGDLGDEQVVLISIQSDREWRRLALDVLGRPDLADNPSFATNPLRAAHRAELDEALRAALATIAQDDFRSALQDAKLAYASVNDVTGLSVHPQLRRTTITTEHGHANLVAPPAQFRGEPRTLGHAPAVGEHGDAIRKEFADGAS